MPVTKVRTPSGDIVQVQHPEGATQDQIIAYAKQNYQPQQQKVEQPNPMTFDSEGNLRGAGEKFLIGVGKAFADLGTGIQQVTGNVSQEEVDARAERDKPITDSGLGTAGNVFGTAAATLPAAFVPGVNTYAGAALTGAVTGAAQPTTSDESRAENAIVGAMGGMGGRALAGGTSKVLNPQMSKNAKLLEQEGVSVTPGSAGGRVTSRIEEKLEGVPLVGDAITEGRSRAIADFNRAAINRALAPIGQKTDTVGRDAITSARTIIEDAYEEVLPNIAVTVDDATGVGLKTLADLVEGGLAPAQASRYSQVMEDLVFSKMTAQGNMSGQSFKKIVSALGRQAANFGKSTDAEQRQLGTAFLEAQNLLKDAARRQSPEMAKQLAKIDMAYANLLRIENAAARAGAADGVFTPSQLKAASRQMDNSLRKKQTTQGKALMQDLAEAGQDVIGNKVPNSGTTDRALTVGVGAGAILDPVTTGALYASALAATKMAYSKGGMRAVQALLTSRPEFARALGRGAKELQPVAAIGGASGALASN